MRDMYRSEAHQQRQDELVIDEIIKAENIEATDEDEEQGCWRATPPP